MGDFKVIETQEQLDAIISDRLKRERETIKKEYEGFLSPEEVAKKDAKIKGYETDSAKTRIAHEIGLSYEAAKFLSGDDEDSIRKSAESLKALMGSENVAPLASAEPAIGDAKDVAMKNVLNGLKGE